MIILSRNELVMPTIRAVAGSVSSSCLASRLLSTNWMLVFNLFVNVIYI